VAVEELERIPHAIEMKIAGIPFLVAVQPKRWLHGSIYTIADFPAGSVKYNAPAPQDQLARPSSREAEDIIVIKRPRWFEEDDVVPMSLIILRQIFKGVSPSDLPEDLTGCLADDKEVLKANKAAYKEWEAQQLTQKTTPMQPHPIQQTKSLPTTSKTTREWKKKKLTKLPQVVSKSRFC
jgi:hypothetical protein